MGLDAKMDAATAVDISAGRIDTLDFLGMSTCSSSVTVRGACMLILHEEEVGEYASFVCAENPAAAAAKARSWTKRRPDEVMVTQVSVHK